MFRKAFFHGLVAGILSATSCIIYQRIHFFATYADFSKVLNLKTMIAASLLACLLAAVGYWLFTQWLKAYGVIVFNFVFSILSFASIVYPVSFKLPLDVQFPELFPGLAVPMHFFPALAWYTVDPLFSSSPRSRHIGTSSSPKGEGS